METTTTIYVCSNVETLNGYFLRTGANLSEYAEDIVDAGIAVIRDDPRVDYVTSAAYCAWHGGTHDSAGVVICGDRYGFATRFVATHERNPAPWLCDLCDQVSDAMIAKARELGVKQANELAMGVIYDIENGDEPNPFVVDNLTMDELEPEIARRLDESLREHANAGR